MYGALNNPAAAVDGAFFYLKYNNNIKDDHDEAETARAEAFKDRISAAGLSRYFYSTPEEFAKVVSQVFNSLNVVLPSLSYCCRIY